MIISAAIISKNRDIFCSNHLPYEVKIDVSKHAHNFLYSLSIQDDDVDLPYIETTNLRYIYKQTDDLYWLLVTKLDSDMLSDINILGKFVCTVMEYGSSETNSTTLTDEQRELFYRHIWRPWDDTSACSFCNCHCNSPERWERELLTRLQFLIGIRDGNVGDTDVIYFNSLIAECWSISAKFSPNWNQIGKKSEFDSETESTCSDNSISSISEEKLIDGCRLKCRLEDLRIELDRLQDPYLRLFAKRDLLIEDCETGPFSTAPSLKALERDEESDF